MQEHVKLPGVLLHVAPGVHVRGVSAHSSISAAAQRYVWVGGQLAVSGLAARECAFMFAKSA